jgi:hypothetical protein
VTDAAISDFFTQQSWLEQYGEILGLERHENPNSKTLRVCFAPSRRVDISFVTQSPLREVEIEDGETSRAHVLLWSKIPEANQAISYMFPLPIYDGVSQQDVAAICDAFFFKASVAIAKTMRNDLLIAQHLALDLARDCLVLQMLRRDEAHGTNIHRIGGFGNEIVPRLFPEPVDDSRLIILAYIGRTVQIFDELCADLKPGQSLRAPLLLPALRRAEATCRGEDC